MAEPIFCDIEHVIDCDDDAKVLIYEQDGLGVIEIRGLENICLLRFTPGEWGWVYDDVLSVLSKLAAESI